MNFLEGRSFFFTLCASPFSLGATDSDHKPAQRMTVDFNTTFLEQCNVRHINLLEYPIPATAPTAPTAPSALTDPTAPSQKPSHGTSLRSVIS